MRRGLVSQEIRNSERLVLRSSCTSSAGRHGFWRRLLGPRLWFIGKVRLNCILEEPKTELCKYQTFTELQWHKYEKVCSSS